MKLFLRKGTNRLHGRYRKCFAIVLIGDNGYYIDEVQYRDENGLHKMKNWNWFKTIEDVTKEAMRMADKLRERYDNHVF